jgi:protein gp37
MSNEPVIQLAHHAFKPWWGYKRFPLIRDTSRWPTRDYAPDPAGFWEPDAQARFLSDAHWNTPVQWNDAAAAARHQRERVLCAPTPDLFQYHEELRGWRPRLFNLIEATPHLDWLLLSRQGQAFKQMLPQGYAFPRNAWLGVHITEQRYVERYVSYLQAVPTAGIRFLYCEPLLEHIDIRRYLEPQGRVPRIDWVVCGGQSINGAEPTYPEAVESLQWQCEQAGVPFFFKQWGNWAPVENVGLEAAGDRHVIQLWRYDGRPEDMVRVGKRVAGRVLNGRTWDQFPESRLAE